MNRQTLRDKYGKHIGEIETDVNGTQVARDERGHKVGTYDPRFNRTYDEYGRRTGEGNLLASLVVLQKHHPFLWGTGGFLLGAVVQEALKAGANADTQEVKVTRREEEQARPEGCNCPAFGECYRGAVVLPVKQQKS